MLYDTSIKKKKQSALSTLTWQVGQNILPEPKT